MATVFFLICLLIFEHGMAARNLLQNPDMESSDYSGNWVCQGGCTLESSGDSYHGARSIKVSSRYLIKEISFNFEDFINA